ncbi:putative universal stress protein SAUSA300_1656 [Crassostrea angulata]|uniref:putative universal stress protein SAUSA300_1656 n=1 Tax=Magallana angulata TaxID=2784310 RepID=UPI0022B181A9|nr:putative universal stress protein SAUSA300_1656 [Crassostrea angulata]
MLKFTFGPQSHSSDVRVPSNGGVTETFPTRTVIVGMDGSEDSRFVFHWYVQNIHRPGDRVVNVFSADFHSEHDSRWLFSFTESVEKKVRGSLDKERARHLETVKKFSKLLENSKILGEVNAIDSKSPGEGIVQAAKEIHASFIVTGTRGLGKVRRTILGSVSDYILRHAPMPVVVCRYVEKKGCEK